MLETRAGASRAARWLAAPALVVGLSIVGCGSRPGGEGQSDVDRLRALPYVDFTTDTSAEPRGVVRWDRERAGDGYNLVITRRLCRADLLDMAGRRVKSWADADCHHWGNAELLDNGDLVVVGTATTSESGGRAAVLARSFVLRLSWNGDVVWRRWTAAHHDVQPTPSGDLVTLLNAWRSAPSVDPRHDVRDQVLALYTAEGEPVRQLSLLDVVAQRPDRLTLLENAPRERFDETEIDLLHVNTVEWMDDPALVGRHPIYDLDHVLLTSRNQNAVFVVDWGSGELVWAWGQNELAGPHGGTVLANGRILVFDNGLGRQWSRIVEVEPSTGEIAWQYRAENPTDFYTRDQGAVERLANGNTLITESGSATVFEVTPDGDTVWKFVGHLTDRDRRTATIMRLHRVDRELIDGLRASAGEHPQRASGSSPEGREAPSTPVDSG